MPESYGNVDPNEVPELESKAEREEKESIFTDMWFWAERDIDRTTTLKGFKTRERKEGEIIALLHSELSEALEAMRHGNKESKLLENGISEAEEELADVIIRMMDLCYSKKWNLPKALFAKMAYNKTRPYMHGGKLF